MSVASFQTSLLGTRLTLWLGPTLAAPAPMVIADALRSAEVSLSDEGRDGFELSFRVGRPGVLGLDYVLMTNPLLKPPTRVILQVWLGVMPQTLIDGFIVKTQLHPSDRPGESTLTVTGEDIRVLMDLHEVSLPYPAMTVAAQVAAILARYATFVSIMDIPATDLDVPLPTRQIPFQSDTDLGYLEQLAEERDCVFYVEPTRVPMVNMAYWGTPKLTSAVQSALSVNMGPESNATIRFDYDGLAPTLVLGAVQDKQTQAILPIATVMSTRVPLAPLPSELLEAAMLRTVMPKDSSSLDYSQALKRAQALTDQASDSVTAEGELDMLRYGDVLRPRRLVGVRGAGYMFDGLYYVKRVTHSIRKGEYRQNFTLKRGGLGSITPSVPT